jgi:hypothetical protein
MFTPQEATADVSGQILLCLFLASTLGLPIALRKACFGCQSILSQQFPWYSHYKKDVQKKIAIDIIYFIINVPIGVIALCFVANNARRMGNGHHASDTECYITFAMGSLVLGQYVFDFGHRPSMAISKQIHHAASLAIGVYTVLRLFPDHPEHNAVPVLLQVNQWFVGVFSGVPFAAVCAALAYYRLGSSPSVLKAWLRTAIICYWSKIPLSVLYIAWLWYHPLLSSGQKVTMTAAACIIVPANIYGALEVCSIYKMSIKMIDARKGWEMAVGSPAQKRPSLDCCAIDPKKGSGIEVATQTDEYELVNMHGPFCARQASILRDITRASSSDSTKPLDGTLRGPSPNFMVAASLDNASGEAACAHVIVQV